MISRFVAVLACVSALCAPVMAQTPSAFSEPQKQAIEGIIKDYLLKNPEVLQDALLELERRQQEAQQNSIKTSIREDKDAIFNAPLAMVVGNPQGDVTLVEFFDYNCGFCKKSLPDMKQLIKNDPKLRVVLKDFPVLGADSVEASRVALAAKMQLKGDKVFEFHTRLMELKGPVNGERTLNLAKEMGLDVARLQKDMSGADIKTALARTADIGDKLRLNGTPAFIIGEEVIVGAVGLEALGSAVASVRKCGKTSC